MDKQTLKEIPAEHKEKAFGVLTFSPTYKQIALIGILCFFIFACLENIVCLVSTKVYWQYYLVSFILWLSLGLMAVSFLFVVQSVIRKIFRKSWPLTWLLVFILFLPNMMYSALQAARRMWWFNLFSKFALLLLVFMAYTLSLKYIHNIIKNNHGKMGVDVSLIVLAWGFSSIFGTLIVGAELQDTLWLLNVLVIISFHFIIPFLIAFLIRWRKFTKVPFKILTACGWLVALVISSNLFVAPFLLKAAYVQSESLPDSFTLSSSVKKRPNIVLIVMDTARAANMSLYGYKRQTTPRLQEFAHDAVVYQNAISSAPWTMPAHATLFTGLPTYLHFATFSNNVEYPGVPLAEHFNTLAEILLNNKYETGAVTANTGPLSPVFGLNQGFKFFWWGRSKPGILFTYSIIQGISIYFPCKFIDYIKAICGLSYSNDSARINQVSLHWIKKHAQSNRPWFLFINYMEMHGTNYLPTLFSHMFPVPLQLYLPQTWPRDLETGLPKRLDSKFLNEARDWYDNEMACLDNRIGRLLEKLKENMWYEDTLIVITSDHGELLGEHEEVYHGFWLYQELLHVPLIVKYPHEENGGQVNKKTVQNSDIFAEILEQAGVVLPLEIVGQPFAKADHPIFAEVDPNPGFAIKWPTRYKQNLQAIYSKVFDHFKLIQSDNGKNEVYDISTDHGEKRKLIDSHITKTILAELENYLVTLNDLRVKLLKKQPSLKKNLDPESLNRLRALGYLN